MRGTLVYIFSSTIKIVEYGGKFFDNVRLNINEWKITYLRELAISALQIAITSINQLTVEFYEEHFTL